MNQDHFDAIIIGSGTSAHYCAEGLLAAGKSIAIIDERPFGGTCALRGCQPKKYLVANSEAVSAARRLLGRGIVGEVRVDWQALQVLKNEFLEGRSDGELVHWEKAGATPLLGRARLAGECSVEVNGSTLTADHIVLATGASPVRSGIPGSEHIRISDDFLELAELPKRILFVGGGYISCEFAFVAAVAGAEVTLLQRSGEILKGFDADMVGIVRAAAEDAGIRVRIGDALASVVASEGRLRATGKSGEVYETDLIIEAIGRRPNLSVLDGDLGNVAHGKQGVEVNAYLQSVSNPRVYALGDCAASGVMLAPVADEQGKLAARNIVGGNVEAIDLAVVPSAVFTQPPIGSVGLTEEAAREQGLDFRVNSKTGLTWSSSKRIGEKHAGYKVLIENSTGRILGAHLARHDAPEVINLFALAMKFGITAGQLASFPYAYPTLSSDVKYMVR
jgi:glutathione reductase (NADPH)